VRQTQQIRFRPEGLLKGVAEVGGKLKIIQKSLKKIGSTYKKKTPYFGGSMEGETLKT